MDGDASHPTVDVGGDVLLKRSLGELNWTVRAGARQLEAMHTLILIALLAAPFTLLGALVAVLIVRIGAATSRT